MPAQKKDFDVIVVGGGHAGCEAFGAACRVGARTALVLPNLSEAGCQPCNPAVGGPGKGHLVREVVALGGLMGAITDQAGMQFRTLNLRKGPAVRSTRVQTDSTVYMVAMASALKSIQGGVIIEDRVIGLDLESDGPQRRVRGVQLAVGGFLSAHAVVVAAGTFLRGELFVGPERIAGGRRGAPAAVRLAHSIEATGLPLLRLKTGTCPRLDGTSIDLKKLDPQHGDIPVPFFDPLSNSVQMPQHPCYLTYTSEATHRVVQDNLGRSPLFRGDICGIGPRYCPSIETKIYRFPDKDRHQIFLEPEDQQRAVYYPSGLSTSLPRDVQDEMVHTIPGLERAAIVRYGYAVEYDAVQPKALRPNLEADGVRGLFLAGQILGTSGYEEAAALGLLAGANAALSVLDAAPLTLRRDQAYAGVMVDDLTQLGVDEPYRMFTSRAEYRLLLREDNADERLFAEGSRTGLLAPAHGQRIAKKLEAVRAATAALREIRLNPSVAVNGALQDAGLPTLTKPTSLYEYIGSAGVGLLDVARFWPAAAHLPAVVRARLEVDIKYRGYLERQETHARRLGEMDHVVLPPDMDFGAIPGLRREAVEKLVATRPTNLGQASRISGITPATIQILHLWCARLRAETGSAATVSDKPPS